MRFFVNFRYHYDTGDQVFGPITFFGNEVLVEQKAFTLAGRMWTGSNADAVTIESIVAADDD